MRMRTIGPGAFIAAATFLVACGGSKPQTDSGAAGTTGTGAAGATGTAGVTGAGGGAGIMGDAGGRGTAGSGGAGGGAGSGGAGGGAGSGGAGGSAGAVGAGGTVGSGSAGQGDTGGAVGSGGSGPAGRGGAGGTGGSGGGGGTVGSGGAFGTGGTTGTCPAVVNCGAALCGNGQRDSCTIERNGCPTISLTESCDGADLGTPTPSCMALGYGSGTVACASNCTLSLSGCRACATDPSIKLCGAASLTAAPRYTAMAGGFGEIGLAWIEIDDANRVSVDFARLSAAFNLLGTTRLRMPAPVENNSENVGVAVAALPAGWAVVAYTPPELVVHAISALGDDLGRTVVARIPWDQLTSPPRLAQRPDGGPLLYWVADSVWRAAVVAADGRSVGAPVDVLPGGNLMGGVASAAYVGDAFYVAASIADAALGPSQLHLRRVETDGRAAAMVQALPGVDAWFATLVSGASDLRVMYGGPMAGAPAGTWGVMLQKVAASGAALSPPVVVGTTPPYSDPIRGVAFGADTVVLVGRDNYKSLFAARIGGDGSVVTSLFRIMALPIDFAFGEVTPGIVRVGSEAVVAWYRSAGFELARIAP